MAKISIIVPVYNTEKYIADCLQSLCGQTLQDIEIVCVDDASKDGSLELLNEAVKLDTRIKVVPLAQNEGTLRARKHGVEAAAGKYMMFVDSDDSLTAEACEKLFDRMEQEQVDILQYGTNVIPASTVSEEMVEWIRQFLTPYDGRLEGREILSGCFLEDRFDFNITDKIWQTELCRRAFAQIEDIPLIASEDRYIFFVLAYYARSYRGLADANYYNYQVGVGITGGNELDLFRFEKRCKGAGAACAVERFLKREGVLEDYRQEYERFRDLILWDCVHCWHTKLPQGMRQQGYEILKKNWSAADIAGAVGRMFFESEAEIQSDVYGSAAGTDRKKRIGIYYRYLGYEPMDDYIRAQIRLAKTLGYDSVLFGDDDISLSGNLFEEMGIVCLPASRDANWDQYAERAKKLQEELIRNQVNLVLYASPTSHIAWLDAFTIQTMDIPVIYMDEERAIQCNEIRWKEEESEAKYRALLTSCEQMEERYQNLSETCQNLRKSRSYRLGKAILWLPGKIRQCLTKVFEPKKNG